MKLKIDLSFTLTEEWVAALSDKHPGLAILRLEGYIDKAVRKSVRKQLRLLIAERGGEAWHPYLSEQGDDDPRTPSVAGNIVYGDFK